jgi:hypothetical protein
MHPSILYCLIIHFLSSTAVKSNEEGAHAIDAVTATQGEIDFFQRGQTCVPTMDAVTVTQGEIDFFQRGQKPGEYWGLTEQVVILSQHLGNIFFLHGIPYDIEFFRATVGETASSCSLSIVSRFEHRIIWLAAISQ